MKLHHTTVQVNPPKDLGILVGQVFNESDRGFVIVCCAYLEKTINEIWAPAKLSMPFAQKIDLLSAMFMEKKYTDIIKSINSIRNKAAHKYEPFVLKEVGSRLSSDVLTPASKFEIYKTVQTLQIDLTKATVTGFDSKNIKSLGDLKLHLKQSKYQDRFAFLLVTISLVVYLEAIKSHPVNKIKTYKFDFK